MPTKFSSSRGRAFHCPLEEPAMHLVLSLEKTHVLWPLCVSGIAELVVRALPENIDK